jgi:formylglycine-generating enzyme required for sulfatase activity
MLRSNTKIALGIVAVAIALLVGAFSFLRTPHLGEDFENIGTEVGARELHERVRHLPTNMVLVLVASGRFEMGTPESEADRDGDEAQHPVEIDSPFYLAETEVTVGLWSQVMGEPAGEGEENAELPKSGVSWHRAMEFVNRMNAGGEGGWRLPTEAEWEYACRAGTSSAFSFGDNITTDQANYDGRYPYAETERGLSPEGPLPVRSFPPNPWGLYEMHGNLWEWCADLYEFHHGSRPGGPGTSDPGASRTIRGGSWVSQAKKLRSGYRDGYPPNSSGPKYGFRVVKSLAP